MGIVIFGSTFVDIKGYPDAQFIPAGRNAGRVRQVHGGVARNVAEDIANVELRPTYILRTDDGLGTWLAVFDNQGDVVASISRRPALEAIGELLWERGDEIFADADSIVVEIDMEVPLLKQIFDLAERHNKDIYAVVSNMSIAMERRDLLQRVACIVCNLQEAGLLFSEEYERYEPEEFQFVLARRITQAQIKRTMGSAGAVYAEIDGEVGVCPAWKVDVIDTTGAGDSFFAGVAIGLTYGKTLGESCVIGTRLAASVIATKENVCPRFRPEELDLDPDRVKHLVTE